MRRPRLLSLARGDRGHRLIVLEAPAGFGKTVLLGQLRDQAVHAGRPVEWAAVGPPSATAAPWSGPLGHPGLAPDTLLLVDDAHRLDASELASLGDAMAGLAPGCQIVVSGRSVALVGLNRWVVHGDAVRITEADLAFDDEELDQLARALAGAPGAAAVGLARWPALAVPLLTGREDLAVAYLRDEVVPDLAPDLERLIAALGQVEDASREAMAAVVGALALDPTSPAAVDRLPLVHQHGPATLIDLVWRAATDEALTPHDRAEVWRALADLDRRRGLLAQAADHAIAAGDAPRLAGVAADALRVQPPLVSALDLDRWVASALLDGPMADFVTATLAAVRSPVSPAAATTFEQSRAGFEAAGDVENEVSVILAAGQHARRASDLSTLMALMGRGQALAGTGDVRSAVLVGMGRALAAQMAGDPAAALDELDRVTSHELAGDWVAQLDMMRATNLLLADHVEASIAVFERATAFGSAWSRASALDLLSMARWMAGDRQGAHRDADAAARLASARHMPGQAALVRAARQCLAALDGIVLDDDLASAAPVTGTDSESGLLQAVAEVLGALADEDEDRARRLLGGISAPPTRALRSSSFLAALDVGLDTPRAEQWRQLASTHQAMAAPVHAGEAAARFRAGGEEPPDELRPYLPPTWCGARSPLISVRLCGRSEVLRNGVLVDHPRWARDRVRELCLHLAMVPRASRADRAAALWPDLTPDRAAANLRVTLSQLLDVLDPDRPRGGGSALLEERNNALSFIDEAPLHIDVRETRQTTRRVLLAVDAGDDAGALTAARQLLELVERGAQLGGASTGAWIEPHQRQLDELLLRSLAAIGPVALQVGEHQLAERAGTQALDLDPWAETSAQLVVKARLAAHDLDGARRALAELGARLVEIEAPPQPETRDLFAQLGRPLRRPVAPGAAP
jgi:DNA-binding SARP family transcriptional activator